jgi:hypothetical protein
MSIYRDPQGKCWVYDFDRRALHWLMRRPGYPQRVSKYRVLRASMTTLTL